MQTSTADGATSTVATEEPPPPRNVVLGRRGVAIGSAALVLYLLLTVYAAATQWQHSAEPAAFARGVLAVAMVAGLGLALYGYGMARAERGARAAKREQEEREFAREQWELTQFESLQAADATMARRVADLCEQVAELRALVAQMPQQRSRRRNGGAGATQPRVLRTGENVVQMPNAKIYQLGIAEGLRRKQRGEDPDKSS